MGTIGFHGMHFNACDCAGMLMNAFTSSNGTPFDYHDSQHQYNHTMSTPAM